MHCKPYTLVRLAMAALCLLAVPALHAQAGRDKPFAADDQLLYGGCWFVPHNATVNLHFTEHSSFTLQDYDSTQAEIILAGKYLLDGHNLWLLYNDRSRQKFYFYKGDGADDNYYIKGYPLKTSAYYFVHGKCE